ncbi:MAG: TonB-dependent receptor [Colwellia sp.]
MQFQRKTYLPLFAFSLLTLPFSSVSFAQQLSGKVVDVKGKPITNAALSLNVRDQFIQTNEDGYFIFNNLNKGSFELHTSAKNYSHKNNIIVITENDVKNFIVTLSPSVLEVIDIFATPLHSSSIESALPVNVIAGDELKLKQTSTLGETLKNEVGVHSSFYGSVASSPIIRGLDGPRVLITQNGLDAGDASRIGADHAVTTETSTATQIEVLRGPATLFYGSGAIGGVVNVVDNRVPTSTQNQMEWLLQHNDVADENQASFSGQTGHKNFALHVDAFWREGGNYKLAANTELDHDEEEHEEDHEEGTDEDHEEATTEHLANSASQSDGFTLGSSYLFDQGFVGFSYGEMNRDYGIPGHHHHHEDEHEHGDEHDDSEEVSDENVSAKMKQKRWQLLSEYNVENSFIKQLATKFAFTDYQHQEIEGESVGTTFSNESIEARADVYHQEYKGWQGAWTMHYKSSDFEAVGEEAFAPPSQSKTYAFAWLEEKHFGEVLLQLGARIEQVNITANDSEIGFEDDHDHNHEETDVDHQEIVSFERQTFTPISTSAGLVWDYKDGYNIGFSTAFSQRAPSAAELFSFGPHIGTSTFEVGALFMLEQEGDELHAELSPIDPAVETSYSVDLTWRKFEGDLGFVISTFYNHVDDYYYQQNTGLFYGDEDALPILIYQQSDVDMYGVEAEIVYQLSSAFKATIFGDSIRAELSDSSESLPRIPPVRLGGLLNYQGDSFDGELSVNHYFEQNNIAELETKTADYTMVDAHVNYYVDGIGSDLVLYLKGQNLTDENAQVHASFLKEVAPLPGRNFSIGIRGSF